MVRARRQILFVDDERSVLDSLRRSLRHKRDIWRMTFLDSSEEAWRRLKQSDYDVVVIDVNMPRPGGLELLERIQQDDRTKGLPVLMLTGMADRHLKRQALDLGATDLLGKPIASPDLIARLANAIRLKSYQDRLNSQHRLLEEKVHQRSRQLAESRLDIVWRLGQIAEQRDEETGNHVIRVGCASRLIGQAMGMDRAAVESLFLAAPLHDIGKLGIPDAILLKPGRLTPREWKIMREHCRIGARILQEDSKVRAAFAAWRGGPRKAPPRENPFLEMAARIALAHHERWDGSGYPSELAGTDIPLEARIVAIADVFDALCSRRPYKRTFSEDEALEHITDLSGKQFDPEVFDAFMLMLPEIRSARQKFADSPDKKSVVGQVPRS